MISLSAQLERLDSRLAHFLRRRPLHMALHLVVLFALVAMATTAAASGPSAAPVLATMRQDAALADVFFTDREHGWAVGDRGVIWHTGDGGRAWVPQESGVHCHLSSVFFLDRTRGWAVGGASQPNSQLTHGVVLYTENGGATWQAIPGHVLPWLTAIEFFDGKSGVATGCGSDGQPSGVFVTSDGGRSWLPLPTDRTGAWLASDFINPGTGAVAGAAGRFATIARRQVVHSPLATPSLRSFRAMRLVPPAGGWIVGDGGVVMTTSDLGRSWQSPPADLPGDAGENFDFHALAVHQQSVWIAGSPGTCVFCSPDNGATWQEFATNHFAPIRALTFVDAEHGWAVGDLGCVLATHDGGRTWQAQRAGGRRAALLAVFAGAADVPLELVAEQGAAEGYLTAVNILHGNRVDSLDDGASENLRSSEAMLLAGAATAETAWRFPLPAAELALATPDVLTALNRANDGRALKQLEAHLVRQLRMWRPDVVVTHHTGQDTSHPTAELVEQLVLRSVAAAADEAQFTELASNVGLPPWQVKKVFGVMSTSTAGDERVDADRFCPPLNATPADFAALPRRILSPTPKAVPEAVELKLLMSNVSSSENSPGLFSGIVLAPGSEARRAAPQLLAEDLEAQRRFAVRRRHLRELLERSEGNAAWAGQVVTLTEGLDTANSGDLLYQLAEGYRATGNLDLAADTYYLLARRCPEHPLVDSALTWLVQYYASSEAAHRAAGRGLNDLRPLEHVEPVDLRTLNQNDTRDRPATTPTGDVQQASAVSQVVGTKPAVGLSHDDRRRRTVQLVEYLQTARPRLYAEPALRFAEVTAQRQLGFPNAAKRYFLTLGHLPEGHAWRRCAATEEWLANPGEAPPPKALATCRRTATRPHLDGRLDEPCWEIADTLRLRGEPRGAENETPGGRVQVAYDDEFLYLAATCAKTAGGDYARGSGARQHDAELQQHDRVELRFDLDRDFTTAFELSVDHRGWCRDSCWGDATWNPTWYIAAADSEVSWTAEVAIPLAEFSADRPTARHVWAVSARRTIPRVGFQSWVGEPTAEYSPNDFGLLIFE